ncbi:MAG: IS30 family transposase [Dinoroseobacter sp.]|jgi:IS30 family transposase
MSQRVRSLVRLKTCEVTKSQYYTHLTVDERYLIKAHKKAGFSTAENASRLGRHTSTIKRELKRNKGLRGYRPKQAQSLYEQRHASKPNKIKMTPELKAVISDKLRLDWSPEQIQGRLKRQGEECLVPAVIYAFIRKDKAYGGDLHKHLRHRKPTSDDPPPSICGGIFAIESELSTDPKWLSSRHAWAIRKPTLLSVKDIKGC